MLRKSRSQSRPRPLDTPQTLQEWMERHGVNGRVLLQLLRERGCVMTEGALSSILKKSRRCSLVKAVYLNELTGVPIKNMIQWPPVRNDQSNQSAA